MVKQHILKSIKRYRSQ